MGSHLAPVLHTVVYGPRGRFSTSYDLDIYPLPNNLLTILPLITNLLKNSILSDLPSVLTPLSAAPRLVPTPKPP